MNHQSSRRRRHDGLPAARSTVRITRAAGLATPLALAAAALVAGCGGGGGGGPVGPLTITSQSAIAGNAVSFRIALPAGVSDTVVLLATADSGTGTGYATGGTACGGAVDYVAIVGGSVTTSGSVGNVTVTTCPNTTFEPRERLDLLVQWQGGSTRTAAYILNDAAGGLNDTGITNCLDGNANLVACSAALPGQDGGFGRDTDPLTNGSGDGRLGFSFNLSGNCIIDRVTGLTWDALAQTAGTRATADANVGAANTAMRCGFNDWRLPTAAELLSLVDGGASSGARIDASFAGTPANPFWTAQLYSGDTRAGWLVDFGSGAVAYDSVDNPLAKAFSSRLVRGTAPASVACTGAAPAHLVDHGNATVTDTRTGLMWQQCTEGLSGAGCASGTATPYASFGAAIARASAVNADAAGAGRGHNDWRVPNRNELASLVNRSCEAPAIQRTAFPGTASLSYWTSSPVATGLAWYVDFNDGSIGPGGSSGSRVLRLVRAGQ